MLSGDSGLRCELIIDFGRLERLAGEWERLFRSTAPDGGTFQSWAWARAFWRVYGEQLRLCTPVLFEGDRVAAILPVAVQGTTARLIGAPFTDYNGVLCEPAIGSGAIQAMLASLLAAPIAWREGAFEGVREGSPLLAVDAAQTPRWLRRRRQVVFAEACPTVIDDGTVFDQLSRKDSLRRHEKRLRRRGNLQFRHVEDREEILRRHLDRFFTMHVTRHALSGRRSPFLSPDARVMVRGLVADLDPARELRFSVLELDANPIAYHLGFEHAGRFVWYMPTFDVDLWNDAPGEVLLRNLLKYAHERHLAEFDLTIGDEEYKSRFANLVRHTFTIHIDRHPYEPAVQVRRVARSVRNAVRRRPKWARRLRWLARALWPRLPFGDVHEGFAARAWWLPFRRVHTIACRPSGVAGAAPEGVRVSWLTVADLAMLRLEHPRLDDRTVQHVRQRIHDHAAYLVSVASCRYVFWTTTAPGQPQPADGQARRRVCLSEGLRLGRSSSRTFEDALTAVLCAVRLLDEVQEVQIRSTHPRAAEAAARRAGYETVPRLPGRSMPAKPVRPARAA